MGRIVTGPDGRRWRIHRRWLPWEPRVRAKSPADDSDALLSAWDLDLDLPDGPLGLAFGIVAAIALIGLIVLLFPLLLTALEVVIALVLLPMVVIARFILRTPWVVVARTKGPPAERRARSVG
ncbi:MAG: hypothetical protein ABR575_10260 [Actinomycetota bacterium]